MRTDRPSRADARRSPRRIFLLPLGVVLLGIGFVGGFIAHREHVVSGAALRRAGTFLHLTQTAQDPEGHWNPIQPRTATRDLDPAQRRELRRLLSLGYAGGTLPAPQDTGVTVCDTARASHGLRLYVSGHAPTALLIDRDGRVLHRWRFDYPATWRAETAEEITQSGGAPSTGCWRRARLLPNGALLAIFEGRDLIKLDRSSQLIWRFADHCHHDLDIGPDGTIYVLTRAAGVVPEINERQPVLVDYVSLLEPTGTERRRIPVLDAFLRSDYAACLDKMAREGDLLHTNAVELLDGSLAAMAPAFARGNLLISIRELDLLAVLDPAAERIVWALGGLWVKQHDPHLLPGGTMLVFDNLGRAGHSKVIELDPLTQGIIWSYGRDPGQPLFSRTCGTAQRLPNGDTLIVESDNGRAIELLPDGTIVWEYLNPRRTGENGALIAAILDLELLPPALDLPWLDESRN
jgi:hypothetical protein